MKYDIRLDPAEANTSHVQVLDLVGTGKRVLDVGCSTGYLAAALAERGNVVTGVELDPSAAELAKPYLDRLLIGNLETLDLAAELGEHAFDVIVFADVLEHLTNPLPVLRQAPRLLAAEGSVVVSIPNVAHGAVRLALLQGRFEYRDLGLLDDTHLRFFTRSSLAELHRLAGLVPVEQRRTVADPFATEIPVQPGDFQPDVVDAVRRDPDATTYQFVIRSVPVDRPLGDDLGGELVARDQELNELRQQLLLIGQTVAASAAPAVGVVGGPGGGSGPDELRAMVVRTELQRRLDGWEVRSYDWSGIEARPAPDGTPVRPFSTEGTPVERSAVNLNCVVLAGSWDAASATDATVRIGEDGCGVHLAGVCGPAIADLPQLRLPSAVSAWAPQDRRQGVADPLLLARRLVTPGVGDRVPVLAASGLLPTGDYVLVSVGGSHPAALGRALEAIAEDRSLNVGILADEARDPGGVCAKAVASDIHGATVATEALDPIDLLAAVAAAHLVITDRAALLWLAIALGRPCVGLDPDSDPEVNALAAWLDDPDLSVATPAALAAAIALAERRAADTRTTVSASDDLEMFFDELAESVGSTGLRRAAVTWPALVAEANARADVLEAVNQGLRHRLLKQRLGFGEVARRAVAGGEGVVSAHEHRVLGDQLLRAEAEVARMQAEVADLVHQINATEATLTMRTLAPARRVYGRLRKR